MWKVERTDEGELVILSVSGRIEQQHLAELRDVLIAEAGSRNLILDMREVRLVDQDAVAFLSYCETDGAELRNCPPYIREWIERDREAVIDS
jgi:hypothetical protein